MVALNGKINTVIQDDAVANITNKNRSARTRKSETALKCQWGVGAEDIPPVLGAGNRAGNIPTVRDPESCTHGIGQGRKIGRKIFRPYGCPCVIGRKIFRPYGRPIPFRRIIRDVI